jgi:hypothetical protein
MENSEAEWAVFGGGGLTVVLRPLEDKRATAEAPLPAAADGESNLGVPAADVATLVLDVRCKFRFICFGFVGDTAESSGAVPGGVMANSPSAVLRCRLAAGVGAETTTGTLHSLIPTGAGVPATIMSLSPTVPRHGKGDAQLGVVNWVIFSEPLQDRANAEAHLGRAVGSASTVTANAEGIVPLTLVGGNATA